MDGAPLTTRETVALRPGERPPGDDPLRADTLPARFYTDPAVHEAEKPAIFHRGWCLAGHVSKLPAPGCWLTLRILGQSIAVVRGSDGLVRAFFNVCQHRGHELLPEGEGRSPVITCPYHAWAYGLDGSLRKVRNGQDLVDFDAGRHGLRPVRCEVMGGLIFVNLDPAATPLAEQSGALETEIRSYVPRLDELRFARRDTYRLACNWKVAIENFLECYHCHPAHRDFVDLVDMPTYRSVTHGIYSSHCASAPRTTESSAFSFKPGEVDFGFAAWFLWPNLTIWTYPGETNLMTLQILPAGPDGCVEHLDWYCLGEPTPQLVDAMEYTDKVLQPEDIALCESVQRGLGSLGFNQGRLVVDRDRSELSEHAIHHFQGLWARAMGL